MEEISEEVYLFYQNKINEVREFLEGVIKMDRDALMEDILPKVIILHHKKREEWLKDYVIL
jgi:hypothetical protein